MNILRTLPLSLLTLSLLLGGCASRQPAADRSYTAALSPSNATQISRLSAPMLAEHPGQNLLRGMPNGFDALLGRLVLAESAERSLDLQYYIWHRDLAGSLMADALLRAADRGVRVRVLLDDVGTAADDEELLALDAHPNVEIRLFNPVFKRRFRTLGLLSDAQRLNRRMHNKAFVVDSQAAILGGRNIGDEYFDVSGDVAFGDLDVLAIGPVVPEVTGIFDRFWNAQASWELSTLLEESGSAAELAKLRKNLSAFVETQKDGPYGRAARTRLSDLFKQSGERMTWGAAHVLFDEPEKISQAPENEATHLKSKLENIGLRAEKELLIISPYFIPGEKGVAWFREQTARGVRVRVLTNSLSATDVGAVHSGYQAYRMALLEAGVELYELKPTAATQDQPKPPGFGASRASLHAKTFSFDRKTIFIGSLNLDPRSIKLNTEIGLLCESPALAESLTQRLEKNIDNIAWRLQRRVDAKGKARIVWQEQNADGLREFDSEPGVSTWRKTKVWFLSLLPIESQL